jgi:hypothetical protein
MLKLIVIEFTIRQSTLKTIFKIIWINYLA